MIVTLIPFLLAARLESPDLLSSKHGTEVTYLVQNHATTHHSGDSNSINMDFHLRALFSCQSMNTSIYCHFHDVFVNSIPRDTNHPKPRKYIIEDLWTKKTLLQEFVEIEYTKNGTGVVWIPVEVEPVGRTMMNILARRLVVGVDLSKRQTGHFETPANDSLGYCRTKYFAARTAPASNHRSSIMNLFLVSQQDQSLVKPLEIAEMVETAECNDKPYWYSFWASRELRKVELMNIDAELNSAENFIIMSNHNFTSFSKVRTTIKNQNDNTKYIIDESISLSLQNIHEPECPNCNDENSNSQEDYSSEEKNVFVE